MVFHCAVSCCFITVSCCLMLFHCCFIAVSCCFMAVSLLFHYCFIAVSCCFIAVSLLFHAVSLLFHCCFIAVSLMFHAVSLLFHSVSSLCFMVFQGVSLPCFIRFHDHETGAVGIVLNLSNFYMHENITYAISSFTFPIHITDLHLCGLHVRPQRLSARSFSPNVRMTQMGQKHLRCLERARTLDDNNLTCITKTHHQVLLRSSSERRY